MKLQFNRFCTWKAAGAGTRVLCPDKDSCDAWPSGHALAPVQLPRLWAPQARNINMNSVCCLWLAVGAARVGAGGKAAFRHKCHTQTRSQLEKPHRGISSPRPEKSSLAFLYHSLQTRQWDAWRRELCWESCGAQAELLAAELGRLASFRARSHMVDTTANSEYVNTVSSWYQHTGQTRPRLHGVAQSTPARGVCT